MFQGLIRRTPKKRLGQNFLVSNSMLGCQQSDQSACVVEICAGYGSTMVLRERPSVCLVGSVEVDCSLVFAATKRFGILLGGFPADVTSFCFSRLQLCSLLWVRGNIAYGITKPLVFRLDFSCFAGFCLMLHSSSNTLLTSASLTNNTALPYYLSSRAFCSLSPLYFFPRPRTISVVQLLQTRHGLRSKRTTPQV